MTFTLILPIILGLLAGFLINYLADVLPGDLKLTLPSCKNPDCHTRLRWVDYLLLRRCRVCQRAPSARIYLILIIAIVFAVQLWISPHLKLGFWFGYLVFIYLLLVALIDLEHRLVLRPISLVGLAVCLAAGLIMWGWQSTLLGAAAGLGIMLILYLLGKLFTRLRNRRMGANADGEEALGSGDVTLAFLLGLLLGWPLIWINLMMGILLAGIFAIILVILRLITRKYKVMMGFIAYGPFFLLIAFILLYFPQVISSLLTGT